MINRLSGLWRDTWWLWLGFLVLGVVFFFLVSQLFVVMVPILIAAFAYYAMIRYDDDGQHKGEQHSG